VTVDGVDLGALLRTVNQRLAVLRDRDHLIGHAFFWPMKAHEERRTLDELRRVFRESIVPLLLEYFHDDLGRVGLVLGKAFVSRQAAATSFADFAHEHKEDLAERPVWVLADPSTLPIEAFKKIYA
jgi:5-methylcytosine-specific restriction protein B